MTSSIKIDKSVLLGKTASNGGHYIGSIFFLIMSLIGIYCVRAGLAVHADSLFYASATVLVVCCLLLGYSIGVSARDSALRNAESNDVAFYYDALKSYLSFRKTIYWICYGTIGAGIIAAIVTQSGLLHL